MAKKARARRCVLLAFLCVGYPSAAALATPDEQIFAAMRTADLDLAAIGYRLVTANVGLCDRRAPAFGLVLHTPSQYAPDARAAVRRFFGFEGSVGVEAVVPASPAVAADVRADDTILAIGQLRFAPEDPKVPASAAMLADIDARLAMLATDRPVTLEGRRRGDSYTRSIIPLPACRTRFELKVDSGFPASADGDMVQIGSRFLEDYPENMVAAVVAHELAHNILHHREKLAALGISFGVFAGFGRNVRYVRQTELEADRLSITLLANAGYDPEAAISFWRTFGPSRTGGALRSRSHPAWQDRITALSRALEEYRQGQVNARTVGAIRDRPLDGDWQALLR